METGKKTILIRILKLLHFAFAVLMFIYAWNVYCKAYVIFIPGRYSLFVIAMYVVCLYFFTRTYNAYLIEYSSVSDIVIAQALSSSISICFVYAITLIAWNKFHPPYYFIMLFAAHILFSWIWVSMSIHIYYSILKPLKTAVIYRNSADLKRLKDIDRFSRRFEVVTEIENPEEIEALRSELENCEAVFLAGVNATLRNGVVKYCTEKGIPGFFLPHVGDIILSGANHVQSFSVPVMSLRRANDKPEYLFIKRFFDAVISAAALVAFSPLLLLTALAVKLYDGGPVLYKQTRLTKGGRRFNILKFRSMVVDAEKDGVARLTTKNDERVTPVGKVIRACRLDEFPQLINIFLGDMSLVGPRPERPEIAAKYERDIPAFGLRLQVKAGLTGYAQIYGKYNTDPYDKLEFDLLYINNMSLITDIQLMFATIRILFKRESTEAFDEQQPLGFR